MKTLELSSGEGVFDVKLQLPNQLLDQLGTLQVNSLLWVYGLAAGKVLSNVKNARDSEEFLQVALVERLHSEIFGKHDRWRSLGLSYLELINLDFCLEAVQERLGVPYRPQMHFVKNLTRDRGLALLEKESLNLGRSSFDEKFDELLEILPKLFFKALRDDRLFVTGAVILDNYVADMVTTLKNVRGTP